MNWLRKGNAAVETGKAACAKSREWTGKHLAEWYAPPALSLDDHGFIHDINTSCGKLFGYQRQDVVNHHVSKLFPQFSGVELVKDGNVNSSLNYLFRCGHHFQAQKQQGDIFSSNLSFVRVGSEERRYFRMTVHPHGGWERGRFVYRQSDSCIFEA
jgi:PAS domain S-box-containing protein